MKKSNEMIMTNLLQTEKEITLQANSIKINLDSTRCSDFSITSNLLARGETNNQSSKIRKAMIYFFDLKKGTFKGNHYQFQHYQHITLSKKIF